MQLPRGVALVMLVQDGDRVVLLSDHLTHDQEVAARVLAAVFSASGCPYTLVKMTDVMAALHAAA